MKIKNKIIEGWREKSEKFNAGKYYSKLVPCSNNDEEKVYCKDKIRNLDCYKPGILYFLYRLKFEFDNINENLFLVQRDLHKDIITIDLSEIKLPDKDINKIFDLTDFVENCKPIDQKEKIFSCTLLNKNIDKNFIVNKIKETYYSYLNVEYKIDSNIIKMKGKNIMIISDNNPCGELLTPINILSNQILVSKEKQNAPSCSLDYTLFYELKNNKDMINEYLNEYCQEFGELRMNDDENNIILYLKDAKKKYYIQKSGGNNSLLKKTKIFYNRNILKYNESISKIIIENTIYGDKFDINNLKSESLNFEESKIPNIINAIPKPKQITFKIDSTKQFELEQIFSNNPEWFTKCSNPQDKNYKCNIGIDYAEVSSKNTDITNQKYFNFNYDTENKIVTISINKCKIEIPKSCNKLTSLTIFNTSFSKDNTIEIDLDTFNKISDDKLLNNELKTYSLKKKSFEKNSNNIWILATQPVDINIILDKHSENNNDLNNDFKNSEFKINDLPLDTIASKCEKITLSDIEPNYYNFESDQTDPFKYIATPKYRYDYFTINYYRREFGEVRNYRREFGEDRKPGYVNKKYELDRCNITPQKNSTIKNNAKLKLFNNENEQKIYLKNIFLKALTPKNSLLFDNYNHNNKNIDCLIKDLDKKLFVVYFPLSYQTSFHKYFNQDTDRIDLNLNKLYKSLIKLLKSVSVSKSYETFLILSNDNEDKLNYSNEEDTNILARCLDARLNKEKYKWTEKQIINDFKVPLSSDVNIIYFSKFLNEIDLRKTFVSKLENCKIYLVNFCNRKLTIENTSLKILEFKNINYDNTKLDFNKIIDIDNIKNFFEIK